MFKAASLVVLLIVLAWGCGDRTEAHLERFLGQKAQEQDRLVEALDPFALVDDPATADRINTMEFSEVVRRLGAHRFQSRIRFEFASPETRAWLREDSQIVSARDGGFRVKVENDGGQGYELLYTDSRFYARNRYGAFHPRDLIDAAHLRWRDAAYGGWAAIYRLYRGRLTFSKQGLARHHGREAIRFSIGPSREQPRLPGTPEPPAVPAGVSQYVYPVKPTPSDIHRWRDKVTPQQARGTMLVDADSQVLLKVEFSGELSLAAPDGDQTISLAIRADIQADGFGNPPSIPAPPQKEIMPIPERIEVDTRPLDFYFGEGFTATLGKVAGVAARKEDENPASKPKGKETGGSTSSQ